MQLTQIALEQINTPAVRPYLQIALNCTEQAISKYIKRNKENGPLTTAGALKVIKEKTGLTDEQILEPVFIL